ncbi:FAD-linked reductases, C-terminal domain-containing protein [Clavulina sp. PMI_390]|nr:FAD-linked reductases, C-terminal domain-containing protein [Clavulina sp. PMI_390]
MAEHFGDDSWSYKEISQTFLKKYEGWTPPQVSTDEGKIEPLTHGYDGPVKISIENWDFDPGQCVTKAAAEDGFAGFEFNKDMNAGNMLGLGWAQLNHGHGRRSTAATGYIHAPRIDKNLKFDVLLETSVTKLGLTANTDGTHSVSRVEIAQSEDAPTYMLYPKKDVILSAGSINSPLIMMLSGIGDPAVLAEQGLHTIVELPEVGKNLVDHVTYPALFKVETNNTFDEFFRSPSLTEDYMERWRKYNTGPMASGAMPALSFHRLPKDDPIWEKFEDPSPGGNSPHWEVMWTDGYFNGPGQPHFPTGNYMGAGITLISPVARGNISLSSTSPFQVPVVHGELLNNEWDMHTLRSALREVRNFLYNAPSMKPLNPTPFADQFGAETDEEVDAYIRKMIFSIWHPSCTTAVGPVLDSRFVVKGVNNLRVVDAGSMPIIADGHPVGSLYGMAEKAADIIKTDHSKAKTAAQDGKNQARLRDTEL